MIAPALSLMGSPCMAAVGVTLAGDLRCLGRRCLGVSLIGLALAGFASPALADQSLLVADNGEVRCEASLKDLTRISLKDDQFASVSKVAAGNAADDFQVVNEPVRGDIYLSVPEGFARHTLTFFGTTRRGYVYKFACTVAGDEPRQVFIANADIEHPPAAADGGGATLGDEETATRLIHAMAEQLPLDGFHVRWKPLTPVMVGTLRLQALGTYSGVTLTGRILRLENRGSASVTLREDQVAPRDALAVSIASPVLAPRQVTTAWVVEPVRQTGVTP
jgi:conjugal transfer pilus assembly protein TraK